MKKLLSIVVLALALCLVASIALAHDYGTTLNIGELEKALENSENYTIDGIGVIDTDADLDELEDGECGVYVTVKIKGLKGSDMVTEEVRVAATHDWRRTETSPDCTTGGVVTWKCKKCGLTQTENRPATSHSWVEKDTSTCGKRGVVYTECAICGAVKKDALGNRIEKASTAELPAHTFTNTKGEKKYAVVEGLTCTTTNKDLSKGYVNNVCYVCGAEEDKTARIEIDTTGKTYSEVVAAVTAAGVKGFTGHQFEEKHYAEIPATCTEGAKYTVWCKVCSFMMDKPVKDSKPLGHAYAIKPQSECMPDDQSETTVYFWCGRCKKAETTIAGTIDWTTLKMDGDLPKSVEASVTVDGVVYKATLSHDWKATAASEYSFDRETAASAAELKAKLVAAGKNVADMCEWGIKSTRVKCAKCDATNTKWESIPHDWTEWTIVDNKADYSTTTSRWERHCVNCEKLEIRVGDKKPCNDKEHKWEVKDPTKLVCKTLNANTEFVCSVCGATKKEDYPIADHDWEVIATIKAATCKEVGSEVVKCKVCGEVEQREVALAKHTLTKVEAVAATCKKAGNKEYYKCSVCEKLFSDAEGKTEVKLADVTIAIDPEAHEWDEGKITTEPTTDKAGVKTYTCKHDAKHTKTEEVAKLTPAAKYTLTALAYNGQSVTGKVVHEEGTKVVEGLTVRVTFFLDGNYYMATIGDVEADGTFSVDGVGPIEYISVVINGSSSVNPTDVVSYGSGELTVK